MHPRDVRNAFCSSSSPILFGFALHKRREDRPASDRKVYRLLRRPADIFDDGYAERSSVAESNKPKGPRAIGAAPARRLATHSYEVRASIVVAAQVGHWVEI